MQAMDSCSVEVATATLCSLDQQLSLLSALLTTQLIAVIVALAVTGCKSLQEKRERVLLLLNSPAEESSRDRGELVLPISSTTSGNAVQADISYFSRELVKYCSRTDQCRGSRWIKVNL